MHNLPFTNFVPIFRMFFIINLMLTQGPGHLIIAQITRDESVALGLLTFMSNI